MKRGENKESKVRKEKDSEVKRIIDQKKRKSGKAEKNKERSRKKWRWEELKRYIGIKRSKRDTVLTRMSGLQKERGNGM